MKKILSLAIALLLVGATAYGQAYPTTPHANAYETWSQMWNISNTYFGTANTNAKLGVQLDTLTNTGTLYLGTAKMYPYVSGAGFPYPQLSTNLDTFVYSPVNGSGVISLTYAVLKCTGTPTVTVTPQVSDDGNQWVTLAGQTVQTVVPTSLTVPLTGNFELATKYHNFYRLLFTGFGTQTSSAQAWFDFKPGFTFYQKP